MDVLKGSLQRIGTLTHLALLTVAAIYEPSYDYEDSEGSILQVCFSWDLPHSAVYRTTCQVPWWFTAPFSAVRPSGLRGSCMRWQQVGSMPVIAPLGWLCRHALVEGRAHLDLPGQ